MCFILLCSNMEMKKRVLLELRNRKPKDVSNTTTRLCVCEQEGEGSVQRERYPTFWGRKRSAGEQREIADILTQKTASSSSPTWRALSRCLVKGVPGGDNPIPPGITAYSPPGGGPGAAGRR